MADARSAAENLDRNLRSLANTLSPTSVEANFSVLKAFADAIIGLTAKVEDCARKLAHLAEERDQEPQPVRQFAPPSAGPATNARWSSNMMAGGAVRSNGSSLKELTDKVVAGKSARNESAEPNSYSALQGSGVAEIVTSAPQTKSRAWWPPWSRDKEGSL